MQTEEEKRQAYLEDLLYLQSKGLDLRSLR